MQKALAHLNIELKYNVAFLIERLNKHLEDHKVEYAEALEAYLAKKTKLLSDAVKSMKKGKDVNISINMGLETPRDISKEYENLIQLFQKTTEEEIKLSFDDAQTIINNTFTWATAASFSNGLYKAAK